MSQKRTLAIALRKTAANLRAGARYEWGHMGRCNCGHLVQTLTGLTDREIVSSVRYELDEWTEHAAGRCEGTRAAADDLFHVLARAGLSRTDMAHLEHLSDPQVLASLGHRRLQKNAASDVATYLEAMAAIADDSDHGRVGEVMAPNQHRPSDRTHAERRPRTGVKHECNVGLKTAT